MSNTPKVDVVKEGGCSLSTVIASAPPAPGEADTRLADIAKQLVEDLFCDGALVPAERLVLAGKGQLTGRTAWSKDAILKRVLIALQSASKVGKPE